MAVKVTGGDMNFRALLDDKEVQKAGDRIIKKFTDILNASKKADGSSIVQNEVKARDAVTKAIERQINAQNKLSSALKATTTGAPTPAVNSSPLNNALIETQRLLAQSKLEFQRLKIEEQQLVNQNKQTANSVRDVSLELAKNRLEQQKLRIAERAAKQSQQAAVGSYKEAQQRLAQLGNQIRSVAGGFEATGKIQRARIAEYNQLNDSLKKFDAALGNHQRNVGNYKSALGGVGAELGGMVKGYLSAAAAIAAASAIFNQSLKSDSIKSSMEFTFGSVDLAEAKLRELQETSDRLGVNYEALASSYKSFIGAVVASNFDFKEGERIFNAVAGAAARLKLSSEDTEGALRALQQMISKGNVQAEELRGQLGERIPGAFSIAARAMGVTESKLNDMLQKGEVLAADLLPRLASELERTFDTNTSEKIDGLSAAWQRLLNVFSTSVSENGNISGFFTNILNGVTALASGISDLVNSSSWAEFFARLTTSNGSGDAIRDIQSSYEKGNKILNQSSNLDLNDAKKTRVAYDEITLAYKKASSALAEYKKRVADGTMENRGKVTIEGLTKTVNVLGAKMAQVSRFVVPEEKKVVQTKTANKSEAEKEAEKRAKRIAEIYRDLKNELALIKLDPVLSNEDKDKKSIDAYNSAIKKLVDAGINPASASINILRDATFELRKELYAIDGKEFEQKLNANLIKVNAEQAAEALEKQKKALEELDDIIESIDGNTDYRPYEEKVYDKIQTETEKAQNRLDTISRDSYEIANSFYEWSDALASVNGNLSQTFNTLGDMSTLLGDYSNYLGANLKVAKGVASGDPGAILEGSFDSIKSAVNFGTKLLTMGKRVKEMNRAAREEVDKFYESAQKGETEYQAQLRERARQQAEAAKENLANLKEQYDLLKSQSAEIDKQYQDVFAKLQGEQFVESENYRHGTWVRKAKVTENMAGLAGMDYDQIEQLYLQGKLTDSAKSLFEQLRKLKEEGADVAGALKELANEANKLFTGTTADTLTDSILQMVRDGKTGVQDLADFTNQTMTDAFMSIFKNKILSGLMDDFYEQFSASAKSDEKLTQDEVASLQEYLKGVFNTADVWLSDMEKVSGLNLRNSQSQTSGSLKGSIQKDLTEQTGTVLAGYFAGFRLEQLKTNTILTGQGSLIQQQLSIAMQGLKTWQEIEYNTRRTANTGDEYLPYLKSIDSGVRDNLGIQLRAAGKYGY